MTTTITTTKTDIETIAAKRNGRITAANDEGTVIRVQFPFYSQAASFIDTMVSRLMDASKVQAQWPTSPTAVVVYL